VRQIVVLAGGKATRLYPKTKTIPKILIKINNEPFILHQIRLFKKNKISEIVFCLGNLHNQITEFLESQPSLGISIKYSIENSYHPLGTLGALKKALPYLDDNFFLIYGDSYLGVDFQKVSEKFFSAKKLGLMTVYRDNNKKIANNVSVKNDMVIDYGKSFKKRYDFVDYGLSIFQKKVLDSFPFDKKLDLNELNKKLIGMNELVAYQVPKKFFEVGSFEGIVKLGNHLKQ